MEQFIKILGVLILIYVSFCGLYFFFQKSLIFYPQKLSDQYKFHFQNLKEEVYLEAEDGARIHGLLFETNSSRGVILYFHGNAGSLAGWGYIAEELLPLGYDLFIIDYRTYGKSRGKLTQRSLFSDAQLAYNYLLKSYQKENIIIYGRSIGTGVAIDLASNKNPAKLILESPFYSLVDVARYHVPWIPHNLILKFPMRTDKKIKNIECPILIIHGTEDHIVPLKSSQKLSQKINKEQLTYVSIEGGEHNNLSLFPEYQKALDEFLP